LATSIIGFVAFVVRLRGTSGDPFRVVHHDTLIEMIALSLVAGFAMVALGLLLGSKSKSVRGAQAITAVVVFPVIFGVQVLALVVVNHTALFAWSILIGIVVLIVLGLIFASRVWNREEALVSSG
jgi:vacuolar-type H+-ATPase subunit I/STV1